MKVELSMESYNMPYSVVIEGFGGGWFDAAQIYRACASDCVPLLEKLGILKR